MYWFKSSKLWLSWNDWMILFGIYWESACGDYETDYEYRNNDFFVTFSIPPDILIIRRNKSFILIVQLLLRGREETIPIEKRQVWLFTLTTVTWFQIIGLMCSPLLHWQERKSSDYNNISKISCHSPHQPFPCRCLYCFGWVHSWLFWGSTLLSWPFQQFSA